ncbi:MAG TPA: YfhO family protein, partial [Longimicrobiales bacterium]
MPFSLRLGGDVAAVAVLVLLLLLAFSPWWAAGRLIAPLDILDAVYAPWNADATRVDMHNHFTGDAVTQYLIYRKIAERSFAEDGSIGWSDLTGGGRPEHANTMALYGDWTMQLHRFLDFWTAWHLGLMGQFLLAALGMFVFLRARDRSPAVALVGAVAYGGNTQFVLWIFHRWQLGAFAWVPWMVWAMDRDAAGRRWAWPLVPVFMALAFLGGNLQTAAFVALVAVVMALARVMRAPAGPNGRRVVAARFLAWSVLGAGLAAFTLLPATYAFLETLEIGLDRGGIGYANGALQPLLSLLFIPAQLFPSLLGGPGSMDLAKVLKLDQFDIAFFGFLPGILACRALFLRGAPPAARWLMILGLGLPLTPLVGPLYHRVQLLFIFGGVWAFAWYFEHAAGEGVDPVVRRIFFAFVALVALWLAGSIAS